MKQLFRRITAFLLSICIIISSVLIYSTTAYALPKRLRDGTWIDVPISEYGEEIYNFIAFAVSQAGAFANADFYAWLKNDETYQDLYDDNGRLAKNVSVDQETGQVVISADFVALIKQALQEYADETNPFKIEKTYRLDAIPASTFNSKESYNTFKTYCASHEIVLTNPQGYRFTIGDITPYIKEGGGFVKDSGNVVVYNGNWKLQSIPMDMYTEKRNSDGSYTIEVQENYGSTQWIGHYDPNKTDFKQYGQRNFIVTRDGGRIRVFNSAAEFMDYNAGQRKVYFGKDFYDYTPADLTATWDEISDTIDHMDDILQQILDKLTDDMDESAIEELLQKILDELRNGGGSSGDGGSSVPLGWFDKMLEAVEKMSDMINSYLMKMLDQLKTIAKKLGFSDVSDPDGTSPGWFDQLLGYLEDILDQLKSIKRWTVIDTLIDGVDAIGDWFDLIHDILSDVDDGMESAVATLSDALDDATGLLKSKFPFSVPWDIFFFVTLLAAEPETPHFEVPIDFDISALDMHIHYDFVLDFTDYQYLSDIFRVILSMTYAVGLLKMTAGIVNTKKEE